MAVYQGAVLAIVEVLSPDRVILDVFFFSMIVSKRFDVSFRPDLSKKNRVVVSEHLAKAVLLFGVVDDVHLEKPETPSSTPGSRMVEAKHYRLRRNLTHPSPSNLAPASRPRRNVPSAFWRRIVPRRLASPLASSQTTS